MQAPTLYHVEDDAYLDIGLNAGSFGGALWTAGSARSSYRKVTVGDLADDIQVIAFQGQHGVYTEKHGTRGRPIVWEGELRVTEAALATILVTRDAWRAKVGRMVFTSDSGREFDDCELLSFEVFGEQALYQMGTLDWWAKYRIVLRQLAIT